MPERSASFWQQLGVFVAGLLILTLGIACTVVSRLGTSPFDAVLVGLSHRSGLSVGSWEVLVGFLMIFTNALLKGGRPEFLGLLTAFVSGIGIDLWLLVLHRLLDPTALPAQLAVFFAGLLFVGIGTSVYLCTDLAPIPVDRLMTVLQLRFSISVFRARTIMLVSFFLIALALQGPIGLGTVLAVLCGGAILNACFPATRRLLAQAGYRIPG